MSRTFRDGIAEAIIRHRPAARARDGITLDQAVRLAGRVFCHGLLIGMAIGAGVLWALETLMGAAR